VNGAAGAVVVLRGRVFSVMAFTVTNGKITRVDALLDPKRLAELDLVLPSERAAGVHDDRSFDPGPE
jgi:RNA polymerase sigma-70 factor (ECF subfamily)